MNICVDENDIKKCMENLEKNKKYLNIKDNLFLIGCILTVNGLEYDFDTSFHNVYFKFSYDDGVKKDTIYIKHYYHYTDCYTFVLENKILPENVIDEIREKIIKEKSTSLIRFERDKCFYELVLNKVENKNDFIEKYENHIENEKKIADNMNKMMRNLCDKIIETKFNV